MANLHDLQFITSAATYAQCPPDHGLEVAFMGRSNAGKSSAINTIAGRNRLAHTGKTPGHTQLLNFFGFDEARRLVDLPGFGYAKVSDKIKQRIEALLSDYLFQRQSLVGAFLLMDIRHPLAAADRDMIDILTEHGRRVHILLTKSDKLKRGPANQSLLSVQKALSAHSNITIQTFSSLKAFGVEQARETMFNWLTFDEDS